MQLYVFALLALVATAIANPIDKRSFGSGSGDHHGGLGLGVGVGVGLGAGGNRR
ncbi:hypothetical protein IW146_006270 [Coemansia sp. RSA 922]|nr:hypothetical protein GGI08_005873 [Coemansia sp. S2]KAJ2068054.1 hypothetical protein GGH13_005059 [Coemansia sp. S155-1]KAJ2109647.1 hypothetical protein IW146_006270 [Coemansia sp. RSA 922]KAJ2348342.1 hypothetical protein GGH92_002856 [Coemansia sp. RSA 2673]